MSRVRRLFTWTFARWALAIVAVLLMSATIGLFFYARTRAIGLITNPIATRRLPDRTPLDFGLVYDEVTAVTSDGLHLAGWYVPTTNGALVIAQHGYKSTRQEMLNEAEMLHRHGYGVLLTSVRAHDMSDGELITFGANEMKDLDAWFLLGAAQPGVDPARIAMLGNSMGGALVIGYAADHPRVRAVVANSPFSSLDDTIDTSVRFFAGLPPFPFAPMIRFWAQREGHFQASAIDAKQWIRRVSPRAVLLMQGGADVVISRQSGQWLYDAAGPPKELWSEKEIGHTGFDKAKPEEYERRVVTFLDTYLRH